jgi:hypothetical protein
MEKCEYHPNIELDESYECPECEHELIQFSKWRKTGELKDAPIYFLERTGCLTKEQAAELRVKQTIQKIVEVN